MISNLSLIILQQSINNSPCSPASSKNNSANILKYSKAASALEKKPSPSTLKLPRK